MSDRKPPGKGDITGMIRSYIVKCEKAGVNIKMNTKVTAQMLKEDTPDAVILATGAVSLENRLAAFLCKKQP